MVGIPCGVLRGRHSTQQCVSGMLMHTGTVSDMECPVE
jgi:hypothetical protein